MGVGCISDRVRTETQHLLKHSTGPESRGASTALRQGIKLPTAPLVDGLPNLEIWAEKMVKFCLDVRSRTRNKQKTHTAVLQQNL